MRGHHNLEIPDSFQHLAQISRPPIVFTMTKAITSCSVMSADAIGYCLMLYVVLCHVLVMAENRGLNFELLILYVVY